MNTSEQTGRYVYCIAPGGEEVSLGPIGLEGRQVYTVVLDDLSAVVHDCPARPYRSTDGEAAAAWILAHHQVVNTAWSRWKTVLPLTFNTIIGAGEEGAEASLKAWLGREREFLDGKLGSLSGKAEYGIQVFWDPEVIAREVAESSADVRQLELEIKSKSRGVAYMYRQRLEKLLKREIEARVAEESRKLYGRLCRLVDNIRVEKTKRAGEHRQMLVNLSCLVTSQGYPDLETELEKVRGREGFSVRVAGPLPPYSFC